MSHDVIAEGLPRLRDEVSVEARAEGICVLDPAQGLRAMIDADMARMVRFLDGRHTPAQILVELAAQGVATSTGAIESAIAALDGMFILDNERGRARAAAARREAESAPARTPAALHVLADDRFDCHACGYCCSNGQNFGPLTEADRDRALAFDWSKDIEGVRGPDDLFELLEDSSGRSRIYLRQRGGRCVFLTDDGLCRIHMRLGWAQKPLMCRSFPFATARTPEGTFVFTRRECRSLERSRLAGSLLEGQLSTIARIAAEETEPIVVDALVPWCGPAAVPYALARAIQRAALHALEAPGALGTGDRLLSVRDLVAGVSARLGERPGEAELASALAFAASRAGGAGPPAPAEVAGGLAREALGGLASLLAELSDTAMKTSLYLRHEVDFGAVRRDHQEAFAVSLLELLALLAPRVAGLRGSVPPFDAALRRAIPLDSDEKAGAGGALRDALRESIHGWAVVAETPLLFGYALEALRFVVATAIARRAAHARGGASVSAEDAQEGLLIASRMLQAAANRRIALRDPRRLLTFFRGLRFGDPL